MRKDRKYTAVPFVSDPSSFPRVVHAGTEIVLVDLAVVLLAGKLPRILDAILRVYIIPNPERRIGIALVPLASSRHKSRAAQAAGLSSPPAKGEYREAGRGYKTVPAAGVHPIINRQ